MFITKQFKLRRYKPENDKGKLAEESRRRSGLQGTVLPTSPERSNILPTTPIGSVGEIRSNVGKTSHSTRESGFFKRR